MLVTRDKKWRIFNNKLYKKVKGPTKEERVSSVKKKSQCFGQ